MDQTKRGPRDRRIGLVVLILLFSLFPLAASMSQSVFPDLPNDYWANLQIQKLVEDGILHGYPDGRFQPEGTITRAEIATMLTSFFHWETDPSSAASFTDLPPGHWATSPIAAAQTRGILKGYPDGTFRPEGSLTKAETVALIIRAHHWELAFVSSAILAADVPPEHWAFPYVQLALERKLVPGIPQLIRQELAPEGGTRFYFDPDQPATRGQVAYLLAGSQDILLPSPSSTSLDPSPPERPVRLIFIHHSTGENWLSDDYGRLGLALRENRYFVSDTNYGWGPGAIGDRTDIGNWWEWFRGPDSNLIVAALYLESGQNCAYSRLEEDPGGENEVVLFKSCFPNSALLGTPADPVPAITDNPLQGQDAGSDAHTVANAKGIYLDLLHYFQTRPDKLFVVITAPPLSDSATAANARAFNQWLAHDWLQGYSSKNVFVFDFYNVLTSNGGDPQTSDLDRAEGNHHRLWNGQIQHQVENRNTLAYPGGDDHPNPIGSRKATTEFLPLLNAAYHAWQSGQP